MDRDSLAKILKETLDHGQQFLDGIDLFDLETASKLEKLIEGGDEELASLNQELITVMNVIQGY